MGDVMPDWGPYLAECLYADEAALPEDLEDKVIDVAFFKVLYRPDLDPKPFAKLFTESMRRGGYYAPMTPARMKQGPSYIELGAWLGDQQTALMVMALGKHLGYFDLLTPRDMGITDEKEVQRIAGGGYVLAMLTDEGAERMRKLALDQEDSDGQEATG